MSTIGKNIQYYRKINHLSQQDLATQLHTSRQNISKWERELSLPDVEMLEKITEIFHVSLDEFMHHKEGGQIYHELQSMMEHLQNEQRKRNTMQVALLMVICFCLFFTLFTHQQLTQRFNNLKTIIYNDDTLKDASTFNELPNDFLIVENWGLPADTSYMQERSYSLNHKTVTIDYRFILKEYTKDTTVSIEFIADHGENKLSFPLVKEADHIFTLTTTLPIQNYQIVYLTIKNGDNVSIEEIGQNHNANYLNKFINEQVLFTVQETHLFYDPTQLPAHFNGPLHGTIQIEMYDANFNTILEPTTFSLSEKGSILLNKPLPKDEIINIYYYYQIDDFDILGYAGYVRHQFSISPTQTSTELPRIYGS